MAFFHASPPRINSVISNVRTFHELGMLATQVNVIIDEVGVFKDAAQFYLWTSKSLQR